MCLYENSGGVGPDHVCTIIADFLMSTSNEMCGGFLVHTMSTAVYASVMSMHLT